MNALDTRAWERFLAYARAARAKQTFDVEERDWKLATVNDLKAILEAARDGSGWLSSLEEAFWSGVPFPSERDPRAFRWRKLAVPGHRQWLASWASADPESLRLALSGFLAADTDAVQRFNRFDEVAQELEAKGKLEVNSDAVLALGSLFNFALEPLSMPIVQGAYFAELEQILGHELPTATSAGSTYAGHLAFACELRARMEEAQFVLRDMIDVQSLIFIAAAERDFWAGDRLHVIGAPPSSDGRGAGTGNGRRPEHYLSVCAIYRNEASYLREWIEFHRLVGVEHFFLYDNLSTDAHLEALAPYVEDGIVTLHEWEVVPPVQQEVFDHCLNEHRRDSRWIAFIDIDEFLFSPTGRPLPELLVEFEPWPGVGANWAMFGMSGHRTRPPGLVIENYLMRYRDAPPNTIIKSIVDPARTDRSRTAHCFIYDSLLAVDENHYPIHAGRTKSVSFSRLRVNHYVTKSQAEARARQDRLSRPSPGHPWSTDWRHLEGWRLAELDEYPEERDDAITIYLPALREALARTESRSPDPFVS